MILDGKCPTGPIETSWDRHRFESKLVNPSNKRKYKVLCVGTGLAGGAAAASLGELGYNVHAFCYQDSARRAHSIAAQGGINAAKNYPNDGDSIYRLFYDTIKGGDFRAREADVWRLAQVSNNIIDQCVAQGVPFARDYAGYLDNRSFGGAQVSRTFYARGQTGQQLLLGAYSALSRQVKAGTVKLFERREMLDLVVVDGEPGAVRIDGTGIPAPRVGGADHRDDREHVAADVVGARERVREQLAPDDLDRDRERKQQHGQKRDVDPAERVHHRLRMLTAKPLPLIRAAAFSASSRVANGPTRTRVRAPESVSMTCV